VLQNLFSLRFHLIPSSPFTFFHLPFPMTTVISIFEDRKKSGLVGFAIHAYPKTKLQDHMTELWNLMNLPEPALGELIVNYVFGIPYVLTVPAVPGITRFDKSQAPPYASHLDLVVSDAKFQDTVNAMGFKWKDIPQEVKESVHNRLGTWPNLYDPPNVSEDEDWGENDDVYRVYNTHTQHTNNLIRTLH
jgi:hypothetical protein